MLHCSQCAWKPLREPLDFVRIGLWPADTGGTLFFEFRYMLYVSTLQHFSPGLSMRSMLQTLQFITSLADTVREAVYTIIDIVI